VAYKSSVPSLSLGATAWGEAPPDPLAEPALYDGVLSRRVVAYLVDVTLIAFLYICASLVFGLAGILTFGALTPLGIVVLAVLPVGYHTIFLGRQGATPGMRLFDLELRAWTGRPPDYSQAERQPHGLADPAGRAVHRAPAHLARPSGRHGHGPPRPPERHRHAQLIPTVPGRRRDLYQPYRHLV
jgi:hypothetical protein